LYAAAQWGTIGIDADYIKPSLPMYFRDTTQPLRTDLRQLIGTIYTNHQAQGDQTIETLSAKDLLDIRTYVENSETLLQGFQIVPNVNRNDPTTIEPIPGLYTAMINAAKERARLTFIDTPGVPTDNVWSEIVRKADRLILVTTPEYAAMLETIDVLRRLEVLAIPLDRVSLVINKRAKWGYSTSDILHNQLSGIDLLTTIPYDPEKWERGLRRHQVLAANHPAFWQNIIRKLTGIEAPVNKSKKPRALFAKRRS
jgi:hypothetical protein